MRNTTRSLVALAALYSSLALPLAAQQPEPSVLCNEGAEPMLILPGEHTSSCAIDSGTDSDVFITVLSAGDLARFNLAETTTSLIELRLEVFDPGGTRVVNLAPGGNIATDLACLLTGTYVIVISESGANESGGYVLDLEIIPAELPPPGVHYNVGVSDTLQHATDVDQYALEGVAGAPIRLTLSETTTSLVELHLELWTPGGERVIDTAPGGNILVDHVLEESGTYLVVVSESGLNEAGGYRIEAQCLTADPAFCPDPGPVLFIDLQTSQASYTSGELVGASSVRLANPGTEPVTVDVKIWLMGPDGQTTSVRKGAGVVLPPGLDVEVGPWMVMPVDGATPLGSYQLDARILDATTGRDLALDLNGFTID